ncbi:hypothetical protein D5086_027044 [Populus alba]|uniref:3'-5' exonuclease domain-containing protein n=2 Tax=Populus alba TaxID=43335 RepID=A0A4U5Q761_POPAL|nr:hypothetical protein D5086_0000127990 [Populus alba]
MEITVEMIKESLKDPYCHYNGYNVHVENHRILTVISGCDLTVSKWIKHVSKTNNDSASSSSKKSLIVGVSTDKQCISGSKSSENYSPYNILQLCVGSHCLIYHLPHPECYYTCKSLRDFFSNPKVIAVGVNIKPVAKQLEKEFEIKFEKVIDVHELAVKKIGQELLDLNLSKFDLDNMAKALLGKHMDVVRPEEKAEWSSNTPYCMYYEYHEQVKLATVDAYLCFLMGWELLYDADECKRNVSLALKQKMKKESKHLKNHRKKKTKLLFKRSRVDFRDDMVW